MIIPIIVGLVARAAIQYAVRAGVTIAATRATQAAVRGILRRGIAKAEQRLAQEVRRRANCRNCKKLDDLADPCAFLRRGGRGGYRGGSHAGVKGHADREANHTPASAAYPDRSVSYGRRPAMQMDKPDHQRTASWGSAGQAYRDQQAALIARGEFMEAFAMDAANIMDMFPNGQYTEALEDAAAYAACLKKYKKV